MNASRTSSLSLAIALVVLLFGSLAAGASGPGFLFATGQEVTFAVLDPGTATCPGGEPTGDPYDPCEGGNRVLIEHQVVQTMLLPGAVGEAGPLLEGIATITIDCSLDADLRGHCWGVFEWQVDSESAWAGVVSGTFDFGTFALDYQLVGRGFGGIVDGMQLQYDVSYDGGYDFVGDFAARVHLPRD